MAELTSDPIRLPPTLKVPKALAGVGYLVARKSATMAMGRRFGSAFSMDLPVFGPTVVISDPALIKDVWTTSTDLVSGTGTLGEVFGPGSTFSLDGDAHKQRRKLLVPAFHGKRMRSYEHIIEEEVMRETAIWADGQEFETVPAMMRITLNAILRAVFGARGATLDELREILPPAVELGAWVAVMPPWARRFDGPFSPRARLEKHRRRIHTAIQALIAEALADPAFEQREDVLSLMLQARYDDGTAITHEHVTDELITLLAAGHETTATTLAWCIERLRRHPRLLSRLTDEVDAGGSTLRQATIWETQRTRPVIDGALRHTHQRIRLGQWVIPQGHTIMANISLTHAADANFPDATVFDPDRYAGKAPDAYTWIPFGGGIRRCIGAAFANMEMDVTLRTLLRDFEFATTYAPGERVRSRGVANAPARGGRALVYRRPAASPVSSAGDAAVTNPTAIVVRT